MSNTPKQYKVFVYGTLRNGSPATHELKGYDLHMFKGGNFPFPSVKKSGASSRVLGNLMVVSKAELNALDVYEGVDAGLYKRQRVVVQELGIADSNISAFIYVGTDQIFPPIIESGDWLSR